MKKKKKTHKTKAKDKEGEEDMMLGS